MPSWKTASTSGVRVAVIVPVKVVRIPLKVEGLSVRLSAILANHAVDTIAEGVRNAGKEEGKSRKMVCSNAVPESHAFDGLQSWTRRRLAVAPECFQL